MRLRRKLARLLQSRGLTLSDAALDALDRFVGVVEAEAESSGDEEPDEDGGEDVVSIRHIDCPHCGERIGIAIDLSGGEQDAIQDCEVCCSPIRIVYTVRDGRLGDFSAEAS